MFLFAAQSCLFLLFWTILPNYFIFYICNTKKWKHKAFKAKGSGHFQDWEGSKNLLVFSPLQQMIVGTEMTVDEANWDAEDVQPNADAPLQSLRKRQIELIHGALLVEGQEQEDQGTQ